MRALQIQQLTGPDDVAIVDVPPPTLDHQLSPGQGVLIDVHAAGVAFPDLLQTRGLYQYKPDVPFVPGVEVAGTVIEASDGSGYSPGDRVAGLSFLGGMAEVAVSPPFLTVPLSDKLDYAQGAALMMNYQTAYFCLAMRGAMKPGEKVLVHGAAGGVGTATIQVARGLEAGQIIAVVSTDEKERIAREAGADEVVRSDGPWKDEVKELSGGGVDIVVDPVGGDRFTDSLRSLREDGRVLVVGFTEGSIPEVKVNRLLLNNTSVVGAAWGAYILPKPELCIEIGKAVNELIEKDFVFPIVGARFPLEQAADALKLLDERGATGKVVVEIAH